MSGDNNNLRYVIQQHTLEKDTHWDLMLEQGEFLKTWRLDIPPETILHHPAKATQIPDHPLRFLTYQGPVNNGKGMVKIADQGTYKPESETADKFEIAMSGQILAGRFQLSTTDLMNWQFKEIR